MATATGGQSTRRRIATALLMLPVCILGASLYGVLNDQVTVTLSEEYFTKLKYYQFLPALEVLGLEAAPVRLQAVVVGVLATWWVGLFLAPLLALCAVVGRRPPATTRQIGAMVARAFAGTALAACAGYLLGLMVGAPAHAIWGWDHEEIIENGRAFTAVGFAHTFAYLGGIAAAALAGMRCYRARKGATRLPPEPVGLRTKVARAFQVRACTRHGRPARQERRRVR